MITGKVTSVYGKDINTDDIIPASFLQQSTDRKFSKIMPLTAMTRPFGTLQADHREYRHWRREFCLWLEP